MTTICIDRRRPANPMETIFGLWRAVMKHWRPDLETAQRVAAPRHKRLRSNWSNVLSYTPPRPRPRGPKEAHVGGWTGLVMVAVACAVTVAFAATLLAPVKPVDRSVRIEASAAQR